MATTLTNPIASDFEFHKYGVAVTSIDGDDDYLILGHHPVRRLAAALNAYYREFCNDSGMGLDLLEFTESIEQRWAQIFECDQDEDSDYSWRFEYCNEGDEAAVAITRWRP